MAKIALVVSSVAHATTQINVDLLVGAGHNVVTLAQAGLTHTDLINGNYDIICCPRYEDSLGTSSVLIDAWSSGIPILCGLIAGVANQARNYGVNTLAGLTGLMGSANDTASVEVTHEDPVFNTLGISATDVVQVYSADHFFARAEKTIPNYSIAETEIPVGALNPSQTAFAIAMKGQQNSSGDAFPSNIAFIGWFYGASGYTTQGSKTILETIEQLIGDNIFITGQVTDENALAGAFTVRVYNALSGKLYSSTLSHHETGNYSVNSRYSELNLMCVHHTDQVSNKPLSVYVNQDAAVDFSFVPDTQNMPPATAYNLVTGNVKKLDLPFEAHVVAMSIGLEPKVLAVTTSDPLTGDYTLDVYPHTKEVILYVAPDYGVGFATLLPMAEGAIVHPSIPNKYVYKALNTGTLGAQEPNWSTQGEITSGDVTLIPVPLYRPLANGFIKPTIVPI